MPEDIFTMTSSAARPGRKPCVNCTCATTGFCPRGVGANIPPELAAANPAPAGKPLSLQVHVDPSVIGGVNVAIGDDVIESTVAARLEDARRQLVNL